MPWLFMLALTWGEVWLLTRAVKRLGGLPVLVYVLVTLLLGIGIAVRVGRKALLATRLSAAQGRLPSREVLAGVVLGFGGFLLALPGVLTDLIALPILLSPQLRLRLADRLVATMKAKAGALAGRMGMGMGMGRGGRGPFGDDSIDVAARRVDRPGADDTNRRLR